MEVELTGVGNILGDGGKGDKSTIVNKNYN